MTNIYQDANGGWIVFDGKEKQFFGAEELAAQQFYRRTLMTSAIVEFEGVMKQIGDQVNAMLPLVDLANDLYMVNKLAALVEATPAGELVGDSTLSKESLTVYTEMLATFITFANTPLVSIGLTPKQIAEAFGPPVTRNMVIGRLWRVRNGAA